MSTPVSGAGSANAVHATAGSLERPNTLGQDAFLRLLIAQLTNQDPTRPKEDTEFIAQLATFSQLEKLTEIAASLKRLEERFAVTDAAASAGTPAASASTQV